MDDGRTKHLSQDETAADRLDHAYAITIHRSQGATFDTVHRLEDGGGRELAYVALSRARQHATAHVIADNPDQAIDDLRREWTSERRQTWAIDTGTPTRDPLTAETDPQVPERMRTSLRAARLRTEREAVVAAIPADRRPELAAVGARAHRALEDRDDLLYGRGQWRDTDAGDAARELTLTRAMREQAEQLATDPRTGRRMRRTWRRDSHRWTNQESAAQDAFNRLVAPKLAGLDAGIGQLRDHETRLRQAVQERDDWLNQHPEAARRVHQIDTELQRLHPADSVQAATIEHVAHRAARHDVDLPGRRPYQPSLPRRDRGHGIEHGR